MSDKFTVAAFNNSDNVDQSSPSGNNKNYDTVMTLSKEKPENTPSKLNKSIVALQPQKGKLLSCQKVYNYNCGKKEMTIPKRYFKNVKVAESNEHIDFVHSYI